MTPYLKILAEFHVLIWLIPFGMGVALAGLGARLSPRWINVLAVGGVGLPWVQSILASLVLFDSSQLRAGDLRIDLGFLDPSGLFVLAFDWCSRGAWAYVLASSMAVVAQVHALSYLSRMAGRHRYHALVSIFTAACGVMFLADSQAALLLGWEGMGLSAAFLYAFWESEQRGERPGIRWLLFQRLSSLLLLLGMLSAGKNDFMAGLLIAAAACVRAGQVPFHGWIPDSSHGSGSVIVLVHGVASSLSAVYLIDGMWGLIGNNPLVLDVLMVVGVSGILLGGIAGIQQQDPKRALVWVFMLQAGLAFLGFAQGDPTSARILVSAEVLAMGGIILTMPNSEYQFTFDDQSPGRPIRKLGLGSSHWMLMLLLIGWIFPPSLGSIGFGRLMGYTYTDTAGRMIQITAVFGVIMAGWIFQKAWFGIKKTKPDLLAFHPFGLKLLVWLLGISGFVLGGALLHFDGWYAIGGKDGLGWVAIAVATLIVGWIGSKIFFGYRKPRLLGRLSSTQRIMDRVAGSGLGLGELLVQVPTLMVRGLGVVIWKGLGELFIDTLLLGTTVRVVEGVGVVLRFFQNGKIQRYVLVVAATVVVMLLLSMD